MKWGQVVVEGETRVVVMLCFLIQVKVSEGIPPVEHFWLGRGWGGGGWGETERGRMNQLLKDPHASKKDPKITPTWLIRATCTIFLTLSGQWMNILQFLFLYSHNQHVHREYPSSYPLLESSTLTERAQASLTG